MQLGYTFQFGPRRVPRWCLFLLNVGFLVTGLFLFGLAAIRPFEAWQGSELLVCITLAAAFTAAGSGMLYLLFRARWRMARLQRIGLRTEATVLAVEPSWLSINGVTQPRVRYRFRDAERRERESSTDPMPPEEAGDWKAGDVGFIYYDPNRPEESAWTGERADSRGSI